MKYYHSTTRRYTPTILRLNHNQKNSSIFTNSKKFLLHHKHTLENNPKKLGCEYIDGDSNIIVGALSRPNLFNNSTHTNVYLAQLFQNIPSLKNYQSFHPSPDFSSILLSACSSNVRIIGQIIPKNLGHFRHASCTISSSVLTST